jgi:hypothetical protein
VEPQLQAPAASQASSHFPLEPVSAAVLAYRETNRRNSLLSLGTCRVGCRELDDYVLLGGFERGCVVGVSAEDEMVGMLVKLPHCPTTLCVSTNMESSGLACSTDSVSNNLCLQ